jgi:phage terminase Nu1 subunit (DNA packaging protein)
VPGRAEFERISVFQFRGSVQRKPPMSKPSLSAVAQHFGLSRSATRDLEIQNVINRSAGLDACRVAYISHLRDRRSKPSAADAHLREARAREIEVRTAERLGKLVAVEEFDAMIDAICGTFRTELSGLPARVTRDVMLRRTIETEITGILHRIADIAEANAARLEGAGSGTVEGES